LTTHEIWISMIYVENKKTKLETIQKRYPGADILDITSAAEKRYAQILSPFYPHGGIPVPFSKGVYATCVEAIWQGLKVFKHQGIDVQTFKNATMKNLKRTVRKYGMPLGHQKGVFLKDLLNYFDARMQIYLPSYKWVLENVDEVKRTVERIKERSKDHDIVFLDYNTNTDFRDISSPISHAGLVKLYIEGNYPSETDKYTPLSPEEMEQKKAAKKKKKTLSKKTKTENNKEQQTQLNLF